MPFQEPLTNTGPLTTVKRLWVCLIVLWGLIGMVRQAQGTETDSIEIKLKTAYFVNIAKFTSWEAETKTLCVFDSAQIYPEIEQLNEGWSDPNLVFQINPSNLIECQLLFWDQASADEQGEAVLDAMSPNLLVVSDQKNALEQGFAVQFFVRNLKLRFAINQDVVKKGSYRISSKLLRLSKQIE